MKSLLIKKIRVIVSLLFFISVSFIFLDISNSLAPVIKDYPLYLQFIPSFIKFTGAIGLAGAGFIFILLISALCGRVYCSAICPLGTLQDILIRISSKLKKKKTRYKSLKPYSVLRYSLLFASIAAFAAGIPFILGLLDPFSNFGRIVNGLFRPIAALVNNGISSLLEKTGNYSLYPVEMRGAFGIMIIFPVLFLALIIWMTYRHGRLFCNSICPVGTLLGIFSRYSLFKIRIDEAKCKACGLCEKVCKAGCIETKSKQIDFSRCVSCYNCLDVCPSDGIGFNLNHGISAQQPAEFLKPSNRASGFDVSKREFISGTAIYFLGLTLPVKAQNKIVSKKDSIIPVNRKIPVTPPGSKGLQHFTGKCTACHLCVSSCPSQVLQPSFLDYGFTGMLMPKMDFRTSYCNFECTACSTACPNGAILPISLEDKKTLQTGRVHFIKENCIVYSEKTDCGACSEHCPTKAVTMVPYNKLFIPETRPDICVGCGACEYACPAKPHKAIYVEGNKVHQRAKKPEIEKNEERIDYKEDFPF